ncbi:ABC transporter substrate-binding protein [Paenibacillus ehimensis]|uniref:ABC transporter substrate-binding protein n=1 Tax=Paenibacillus ehimensis TaxID=79264 RepID=A0ABT8VJX9_9BACL|nr:ABC transporter substrate-binding protein [Paenibacillus ehimensis]MDO3681241.1 ABC transporter substrate-binding protein [Paenibacillus ehimensis]
MLHRNQMRSEGSRFKPWRLGGTLALLLLASACGPQASPADGSEGKAQAGTGAYPRSIVTGGKHEVVVPAKPERIAALSLDTAEMALELADPSRIVVAPRSLDNEQLSVHAKQGKRIGTKITGATKLDPEQVLSYKPDLVLMTTIHDGEKDADPILKQAGIPVLTFKEWGTVRQIMDQLDLIGQALGEEEKAKAVTDRMKSKLDAIRNKVGERQAASKPTVLVLSPVGPNTGPYMMGPDNISSDLVRLAGGVPAVEAMGLSRTTKATIEQMMQADPDCILLSDWEGKKELAFRELTGSPGWSALKAVKEGRVRVMAAKQLVNANPAVVDSIAEIADFLEAPSGVKEEAGA